MVSIYCSLQIQDKDLVFSKLVRYIQCSIQNIKVSTLSIYVYKIFFFRFFLHLNIFKQNLKGFLFMFYLTKTLIVQIFYNLKTFLGNDTGKRFSNVKSCSFYVALSGKRNHNVTLPYITFLKRSKKQNLVCRVLQIKLHSITDFKGSAISDTRLETRRGIILVFFEYLIF